MLTFKEAKAEAIRRHGLDTARYSDFMRGWYGASRSSRGSVKEVFGKSRRARVRLHNPELVDAQPLVKPATLPEPPKVVRVTLTTPKTNAAKPAPLRDSRGRFIKRSHVGG